MSDSTSHREALQLALLKSERVRLLCVLGLLLILSLVYAIRIMMFGLPRHWAAVVLALICLAVVEIASFQTVNKAFRQERVVPAITWVFVMLAEFCVPALCVALLVNPEIATGYRALASPWVLIFFPLMMLSTLRLNPWLSRFAGLLAGSLYLAAAYHLGWRPALADPSFYTTSQSGVTFYAVILFASGWVAGAVAAEIRKHVESALSEIETRQQLKQIEHDLSIARSVQQSLLPQAAPSLPGFDIAGWNHSADATGGDFFDWQQLVSGKLIVMLSDATGHGLGPALLAAVCRAYAKASFKAGDSLAETVQNINRLLAGDLTPPNFATFVAAVCNQNDDTVEIFSAGHGPLLTFTTATGTFKELDSQSLPLGLIPEIECTPPTVLHMQAGDMLFLLTDGFIEWENREGEEFGLGRVMQTVRPLHNLGSEEIIRELYRSVLRFADGSEQRDDLTAIIIKRIPVGNPIEVGLGRTADARKDLVPHAAILARRTSQMTARPEKDL